MATQLEQKSPGLSSRGFWHPQLIEQGTTRLLENQVPNIFYMFSVGITPGRVLRLSQCNLIPDLSKTTMLSQDRGRLTYLFSLSP